jgi:transposase-like protein
VSYDAMAFMMRETRVSCPNCRKVAFVDALQRLENRWTCYSCGRICNVAETTVKEEGKHVDQG